MKDKKLKYKNKYTSAFEIKEFLYDDTISIQERMFVIAMSLSIVATLYMAVVAIFSTNADVFSIVSLLVSGAIMMAFIKIALKYNIIEICTKIFIALVIFILFPLIYFTGGGHEGGIIAWNIFGVAYILVLLEGKCRLIYLILDIIIISFTYGISYFYPETVVTFSNRNAAIIDSYSSFILSAIFIAILVYYQNTLFLHKVQQANEQIKEIEALNVSQSNFFSNMSHEIRTPINTIIGLNEMTLREESASDEAIENAMNIESASKMLLSLINDILDMSKMQSGKMDILPVQYDTKILFSDIVNMVYVQAKNKNLDFKVSIDPNFPSILLCDEVRLRQIIINLLNNAVKYTKEGGVTLQVRCEVMPEKKILTTFSISDTGIGIRKENIPYLFDSFKRVDQSKNRFIEGTGLGLSICKQLSDLMNGKISVDSVYTKGSTFHFEVEQVIIDNTPIGDIDFVVAQRNSRHKKYHQSFEAPSARVLVVDDNELNRTVATKLLRDTRVKVDCASSGMAALDLTMSNYYHIILMDHMMPEMDGIECAYKIKNQVGGLNNETPIIALTANVRSDSNEFYQNAGFDSYLSKPISGTTLEAVMLKYLPGDLITYIDLKSESVLSSIIDSDKVYKKKTAIVTNSTADLSNELLEKYNIVIIPYTIKTKGGSYLDGYEINGDRLIDYVKRTGDKIEALAPTVEEYEEHFSKLLNVYDEIIYVSTHSELSPAGLDNAYKAAATFGSIHIIDSKQFSGGLALIVMFASMLLSQGLQTSEILKMLEKYSRLTESNVILSDSDSIFQRVKVPKLLNKVYNSFMLKPALVTRNAKFDIKARYFGKYDKCVKNFIKDILHNNHLIDDRFLLITYTGMSVSEVNDAIKEIEKYTKFSTVNAIRCSAVNYTITGKRAIGFFYFNKT